MPKGIVFKTLTIKNFLSFGNNPTKIDLRGNYITAVLGLNHDTGGDESRNGVGKSALIDSISYVLYGNTIRGISNAKLVNKLARKGQGMLVVLEIDTPHGAYRIERGEAPSKLKLFRKELDDPADFLTRDGKSYVYDISRNKNETTDEIKRIIGFDIKLFEFLIANSSESTAFMKMSEDEKRRIAERLMGLNLLTERAEELKEDRKEKKKNLISAEASHEATVEANRRIERQIADLKSKEIEWEEKRKTELDKLRKKVEEFESVDVDQQIEILTILDEIEAEELRISSERKQANLKLKAAERDLSDLNKEIDVSAERFKQLGAQQKKIEDITCPTCDQHWVADPSVLEKITDEIDEISNFSEESVFLLEEAVKGVDAMKSVISDLDAQEEELSETAVGIGDFELVYDSVGDAKMATSDNKNVLDRIHTLENLEENPHTATIDGLKSEAIKETDDSVIRELHSLINHYNYLIDLLQSKDSFLRKAVIDRWLPKLNGRIAHYLTTLELPYTVRIENDLTMSIRDFGEEFDWGNLSKGQRQRVTIALNLSFQDLFEATNHPLSLLMVDELIDSGICNRGAGQAVKALRDASKSKDKRVFLITHREDIVDQVEDVMLVEMKNRISKIAEAEEVDD